MSNEKLGPFTCHCQEWVRFTNHKKANRTHDATDSQMSWFNFNSRFQADKTNRFMIYWK